MHTLIVNLGLRSVRAIVFDERGQKVTHEWFPVGTSLNGDRVEQDPAEWWGLAVRAIRRALADLEDVSSVRYMSVTCPSGCLVVLGADGGLLAPSLMVADKRAREQAESIRQTESLSTVFENGNNLAEASYLWPKILWLQEHEPEVVREASAFLNANDYLAYRFSGMTVTDPLNAEKLYFDPVTGEYPRALLDRVGLSERYFPEVQPIGTDLGPITSEAASETGLSPDTRFVLTTYDAICAFWGSGVRNVGEACSVSGTSLSCRVLSLEPAGRNEAGILSQYYSPRNAYVVGGSNNLDGGLLEWARDCFYSEGYTGRPDYLYELMQEEAAASTVGARGLVFVPYLIGERVPRWDPDARGVFFGLERYHRRSDIVRSIFESTGFLAVNMINAIESSGVSVDSIRMSGGLSRMRHACELRAHITGKPVHILAEHETAAMGAYMAVAQSVGLGRDPGELSQLVRIAETFEPDNELHEQYAGFYELFEEVYQSLESAFRSRSSLLRKLSLADGKYSQNL